MICKIVGTKKTFFFQNKSFQNKSFQNKSKQIKKKINTDKHIYAALKMSNYKVQRTIVSNLEV